MQGIPLEEDFNSLPTSPRDPSHEVTTQPQIELETRSVDHSEHNVEGEIEVIEEGFLSLNDPPLTNPLGPPLLE